MAWNDELEVGSAAHSIAASVHRRIRVLAGPGTGKSFAMKRRVARLLEDENIPPERILAVTFTRVAAEDLHRELVSLGVPGSEQLNGRTLHSLAMSILMRQHVLDVLGRTPRPLNDFEIAPLLADLSSEHGDKRVRRRLIQSYGAAWARLQADSPDTKTQEEIAFERDLLGWLNYHDAMLMEEIIPQLLRYLRSNPGTNELSEFDHLLIDEYQDLNKAEQEILHLLGQNGSVCVIGDDDQSIYSFKHAHPEGIREWATIESTEEHAIDECRRCPTSVVRMANTLISHNAGRIGTQMLERSENGAGQVVVRQYDSFENEAEAIKNKISLLISSGVEPKQIIVLAQRKKIAIPIYRKLLAAGVPAKSYYAETALDNIKAQERYAILKLLINSKDLVSLRWLLGYEHNEWHAKQYKKVMDHAQSSGLSVWQTLEGLESGTISITHTKQIVARFTVIKTEVQELTAIEEVSEFISKWLPEESEDIELLRQETLLASQSSADKTALFNKLDAIMTQPDVPSEVSEVRIMSLHKSKGLSAGYVFIAACVEGLHPSKATEDQTQQERNSKIEEDRRLFYVGITRVKSDLSSGHVGYLALTHSQTMPMTDAFRSQIDPVRIEGSVAYLQASRFLSQMAPHIPDSQFNTPL